MTAEEFLNRLQQQGLINEKVFASLLRQVRGSQKAISAQAVAKLLVDKGRITSIQARELLNKADREQKTADDLAGDSNQSGTSWREEPKSKKTSNTKTPGLTLLPDDASSSASEAVESSLHNDTSLDSMLDDPFLNEPTIGSTWDSPSKSQGGMRKKVKAGQWDSPLMLIGGGVLLFLFLVGGFLFFILNRGTADELFEAAQTDYKDRSYSSAIEKYEKFIKKYSKNEKVSLARVKKELARLRLAVEANDWKRSLQEANEILPKLENENLFSEARPELASLLPDIAEAFSLQAKKGSDSKDMVAAEKNYDLAMQAMLLVNNGAYISSELRESQSTRIEQITDALGKVKTSIDQDKELSRTVASIEQLVSQGKTTEAYAARHMLLETYPGLVEHEDLQKAVLLITDNQRALVKSNTEPLSIQKDNEPSVLEHRIVLTETHIQDPQRPAGPIVLVLARGTVYGIHSGNGKVLWKRFVGYETSIQPQVLSNKQIGGAILVDRRRNELLRVHLNDGQLVWRIVIKGRFAQPIIHKGNVYLATSKWVIWRKQEQLTQWWTGTDWSSDQADSITYDYLPDVLGITGDADALAADSGELIALNLETGQTVNRANFPQALPAGPAFHTNGSKLYVLGEHSNLYVLSVENFKCEEVFYLGHKAGDIDVPPAFSRSHLLIPSKSVIDRCVVHLLSVNDQGGSVERIQQRPLDLKGHVLVPLQSFSGRILLATDRGEIQLLGVTPENKKEPISLVGRFNTSPKTPITPYLVGQGGQLWIGDYRFSKLKIQTTLRKVSLQWIKDEGSAFLSPLQIVGDTIIRVRRIADSPGVNVSAVRAEDAKPIWNINLGAPLAGPTIVDKIQSRLLAISGEVSLFEIDQDTSETELGEKSLANAASGTHSAALYQQTILQQDRLAISKEQDRQQIVIYDGSNKSKLLRSIKLDVPAGPSRFTPVSFQGGLLVPSDAGQLFLLDTTTGKQSVLPFQPALEPGVNIGWNRPAVVGADGNQFVITDTRGRLYLVGIQDNPRPHLSAIYESQFDLQFVSPLAAIGNTIYTVTRDNQGAESISSFIFPELKQNQTTPLEGSIVWGPERVNDVVFFSTSQQKLLCFAGNHQLRWEVKLSSGLPVGLPLEDSDDFLLATKQGTLLRLNGESGQEVGKSDLGEPILAGPVLFNNKLWINGADGTLLVVPMIKRSK